MGFCIFLVQLVSNADLTAPHCLTYVKISLGKDTLRAETLPRQEKRKQSVRNCSVSSTVVVEGGEEEVLLLAPEQRFPCSLRSGPWWRREKHEGAAEGCC